MNKTGYQILRQIRKNYARACPPPQRPFDNGKDLDKAKAVEYAIWIANRDGVVLPRNASGTVRFKTLKLQGFKEPIKRAVQVNFNGVQVKIPHTFYDPTIPAKEFKVIYDSQFDFEFNFKKNRKKETEIPQFNFQFNFKKAA